MKTIEIPYEPREWTHELHESEKRWKVIVAHRRSGKTVASLNHLQRDALTIPNSRYAYISPTYKQSKNIAWDALKEYANAIPGVKFNEAELRCDYPNGSRITLYGADNPDALRGIGLWGVIFDEYSQQPANIFSEIIRPALADHSGYAIWIGTPKGKNDFWRLYDLARKEEKWLAVHLTVDDTKVLSQEELEDAKLVMDEDEYLQEFYCSFEASIKGAYYADQLRKAREEERITVIPHEAKKQVMTWWDLGVSDATAILFFQHVGKEWRMIDCYQNSGEGLEHYIQILQQRAQEKGYIYQAHYAPHDIDIRELGTGESRIEVARKLGINFHIAPKLQVGEGIGAVRRRFNELWIEENKCADVLDALALYRKEWDEKRGEFKPRPFHDWTSHFCFTEETPILTPYGSKQIQYMLKGEKVVTPLGDATVLAKEKTGTKMIYRFMGMNVTANHPFMTQRGFIPLDDLRYSDTIYVWKEKRSSLTGSSFTDIQNLQDVKTEFISEVLKRERSSLYTATYGKSKMVQFLKDIVFITKMEILLTMPLKILNFLPVRNIKGIMLMNLTESQLVEGLLKSQENMHQSGMAQKKEEDGTVNMLKNNGKIKNNTKENVTCARSNTKPPSHQDQSSAQIIASLQCCGEEEVYNLCTSKGVFLANNVLVSNSDALRYWAVSVVEREESQTYQYRPKWKGHYGQKSIDKK